MKRYLLALLCIPCSLFGSDSEDDLLSSYYLNDEPYCLGDIPLKKFYYDPYSSTETESNDNSSSSNSLSEIDLSLILEPQHNTINAEANKILGLQSNIAAKYSNSNYFHQEQNNRCLINLFNKLHSITESNKSQFINKIKTIMTSIITPEISNDISLNVHKQTNSLDEIKLECVDDIIDIRVKTYRIRYYTMYKSLSINMIYIDQKSTIYQETTEKISNLCDLFTKYTKHK